MSHAQVDVGFFLSKNTIDIPKNIFVIRISPRKKERISIVLLPSAAVPRSPFQSIPITFQFKYSTETRNYTNLRNRIIFCLLNIFYVSYVFGIRPDVCSSIGGL